MGFAFSFVRESDHAENQRHSFADGAFSVTGHTHGKSHVIKNRHFVNEPEILKDNAHGAPQIGYLSAGHGHEIFAVDLDNAVIGYFFPYQEFEQGAFTSTGRPYNKYKFTVGNIQRQISDGVCSVWINFCHIF